MEHNRRSSLAFGIVLVLAGILLTAALFVPEVKILVEDFWRWPTIIIGVGVVFFLAGLLSRTPDLLVSAFVIGGLGGMFFWLDATGSWKSMAYLWTLIPGFSAVGMISAHLAGGRDRYPLRRSLTTLTASLVLFAIFGTFFGGFNVLGGYWPVLLIAAGLLLAGLSIVRPKA